MPASAKPWYRRWLHKCNKILRGVTRLEDTPYRIAMGCACGLFCSVLPIFGQMIVGMVLSKIFRANVVASIPWTWISNPATTLPIWYGCYLVGAALTRHEPVTWAALNSLATQLQHEGLTHTIQTGGAIIGEVIPALLLGTVTVGTLLGATGYICIKPLVIRLQARRLAKLAYWEKSIRPATS